MKNKFIFHKISHSLLVIALLILSIRVVAFSSGFYIGQYDKLNTAETMNLSEEDLQNATSVLLDYIKGDVDSIDLKVSLYNKQIEMFNQKEKDHMIDVKHLYTIANTFMMSVFGLNLLFFIFNQLKKRTPNKHEKMGIIKDVYLILGLVFLGLSLFALTNFDLFWTTFHKVLFTNDLWLLDPRVDRMINMFPLPFFNAMVTKIIITFISLNIITSVIYVFGFNNFIKGGIE